MVCQVFDPGIFSRVGSHILPPLGFLLSILFLNESVQHFHSKKLQLQQLSVICERNLSGASTVYPDMRAL